MLSREQINLARPARQLFHTLLKSGLQYPNFQCLIVNHFKLCFCFHILDNDTIFSRNTPAKNGKALSLTTFRIFPPSLPAPQMELASVLFRGREQWSSGLCFPRWYQWWRRMMVTDMSVWCFSCAVFQHTSQRLHKLELFDNVLCWDWVVDSLGNWISFQLQL